MKIYVTKYALTEGILEFEEVQHTGRLGPGEVMLDKADEHIYAETKHFIVSPKDWFRDLEEAQKRASALRDRKIKNLEKQIAKLRALDLTPKPG